MNQKMYEKSGIFLQFQMKRKTELALTDKVANQLDKR